MIEGTAHTFAALVVSKLMLVLNSVMISRLLGSENLGILAILWNLMALAGVFATWGIHSAVVKMASEKSSANRGIASELITASILLGSCTAVGTSVAVTLLAPLIAGSVYGEDALLWLLPAGAISLVISSVPAPAFALFQGFQRLREMNLRNILFSLVSVPITVALVWQFGLVGAAVAGILVAIVNLLINVRLLRRIWKEKGLTWRRPKSAGMYRAIASYGSATVSINLAVIAVTFAASTLLVTSHSFRELGYFSVALALAGYVSFIPASIGVPMIPVVSEIHTSTGGDVGAVLTRTLRIVSVVVLPLAVLLQFVAAPVVDVLYGPEYAPAADLVVWMAAAAYMISLSSLVGFAILGTGRIWHGVALNVQWGVMYAVLAVFLIRSSGAEGLAAAFALAYAGHLAAVLAYSGRVFAVRMKNLAPMILPALAILGAGIAANSILPESARYAAGILGAGALALVGWQLLSESEKEVFRSAVARLGAGVRRAT